MAEVGANRATSSAPEGSILGLALFRIVVGLMALRYLAGFARDYASNGFYGHYFFVPYAAAIPQPTEFYYLIVLAAGAIAAVLLIIGYHTRFCAIANLIIVAYHLSLNQIWHSNDRYFLVLSLFLLCIGPSYRALSFDARRLKLAPMGPLWTGFLIKAQMTLIYLASAFSKAANDTWRAGNVAEGHGWQMSWARWMPEFVLNVIPPESAVRLITGQVLVTEFVLAIFLWVRPTRRFAIWLGILFHGYMEVRYSVGTFSYLALATYFVFADLKCGPKAWVYSSQSVVSCFMARVICWLDWLFQVRMETYAGTRQRFIDRDGTPYGGIMGWIMLGANLPIFYAVCFPLSWLRFLKVGRCRFSIMSVRNEAAAACRAVRITQWAMVYLLFLTPINFRGEWQSRSDAMRFWDLPWFFLLMCLIAGVYRQSLMRNLPATRPTAAQPTDPKVQPIPTAH